MSNKDDDMEEVLEEGRKDYPSEGQRSPNINSLVDDIGSDINDFGRGAAQGGTANLHDEAVAGIKAGGKTIYDYAIKYLSDGGEPEGLVNSYKRFRTQERDLDKQSQQESPLAYNAGQFATAAALPGSSVKALAAQGAASSYGASDSNTIAGDLGNAAAGGVIGAGIGKLANRLQQPAKEASEVPFELTRKIPDEVIPQKGELNIHDDVLAHENKNKEVQDRIAAFRKKKAAGEHYNNKSDQIAKDLYGMDPVEGVYDPKVDDITIPEDKRQLFGVKEAEYNPSKPVTEQDRMLWGESPMPKQSKVPTFEYDADGIPISSKSSLPQQSMKIVQTMQSNPELLGPYGKILTNAAKKGLNSFLTTTYVLSQKDPQFRKLVKDLNNEQINAEDLE